MAARKGQQGGIEGIGDAGGLVDDEEVGAGEAADVAVEGAGDADDAGAVGE